MELEIVNTSNLIDALNSYFKEEILEKNEIVYCDICQKKNKSFKKANFI